jgi:hypothetical protein
MPEINCLDLIDKFLSSSKGSTLQKENSNILYAKTNIFFLANLKNNSNNVITTSYYYCENNMFNFDLMSKINNIQINNTDYLLETLPNLTIITKIN